MASGNARGRSRAAKAAPSPQNRNQQSRPGDATGMERERLQKEHAAEIQQAATQTTLVNPPPRIERPDEVVDYTDGGDAHTGGDQGVRLISMEEAVADGNTTISQYDVPEEQLLDAELSDGRVAQVGEQQVIPRDEEPRPAHERQPEPPAPPQRVEQRQAPVVEQAHRILRVNTDLEDITIGKDNHYTFLVNSVYKVPAHVWEHLYEKGYVLA